MNEYQINLFYNLQQLVAKNEAFYASVFRGDDGCHYVIFNYRLASYSDFLEPSALEARGIMFEVAWAVGKNQNIDVDMSDVQLLVPIRLACMTPEKFFNYKENPFTMDIDFDRAVSIHDKADGSLVSSYMDHNGHVRLKTKGSLFSDQVYQAEQFLFRNGLHNYQLAEDVVRLTELDFTVNMEWCAPENRIVLGYSEPSLKVFSVRSNVDGSYINRRDVLEQYNCVEIYNNWVYEYDIDNVEQFVADLSNQKEIEGVVITLDDDQKIKIKTEWYLARHHVKDSINTPRRLFEAVVEDASDDMKAMFSNDPQALTKIEQMEQFVYDKYNHMVSRVEQFYQQNKDLDRKDYAIKGQKELDDKTQFNLAMSLYTGKTVNYKDALKKRWKEFKLKDEKEVDE